MAKHQVLGAGAALALVAAAALTVGMATASRAQPAPDLEDCADVVGTYLTKSFRERGNPDNFTARSLLSLTNGGHAIFADSAQAGTPDYRPFSIGKGAWRCVSKVDGKSRISVVILDFTFATKDDPKQQIGRLDLDAVVDAETGKLDSKATLHFVPLPSNPMDQGVLGTGEKFRIVGEKVSAP